MDSDQINGLALSSTEIVIDAAVNPIEQKRQAAVFLRHAGISLCNFPQIERARRATIARINRLNWLLRTVSLLAAMAIIADIARHPRDEMYWAVDLMVLISLLLSFLGYSTSLSDTRKNAQRPTETVTAEQLPTYLQQLPFVLPTLSLNALNHLCEHQGGLVAISQIDEVVNLAKASLSRGQR